MQGLLAQVEFRDPSRALANIDLLSRAIPSDLQRTLRHLLAAAADPDGALHWLESLHSRHPDAFARFASSASALQYLVAIFSHSRFLSEEVVSHPEWIDELLDARDIADPDSIAPEMLAQYRRKRILRILVQDVLGLSTLADTASDLSDVADILLDTAYRGIRDDLIARYGVPLYMDEAGEPRECGFSIIALGKLGGRELNYSSDIDLMFVYTANGETGGTPSISNKEFFSKVANELTRLLSAHTAAGRCYRVDLRLRPDGRLGEVCLSLDGARSYYRNRAGDWELQMLIKARVAAGERAPGRELLEQVEPLIYSSTLDFSAVELVSLTRERLNEKLASRRANGFDVKLAPGGIRDIEFLVQCLQRLHGGREPWVRHGGTMKALFRLHAKSLLSDVEYSRMASAYEFLRHLEHRLQFDQDLQTHTLPTDRDELARLARRMPHSVMAEALTPEALLRKLNHHLENVQEIYERVIHAQKPIYYTNLSAREITPPPEAPPQVPEAASNIVRFMDHRAPELASMLARRKLQRGARHFEHLLERLSAHPTLLDALNSDAILTGHVLDLFEHSPYFAEQIIRTPDLIEELQRMLQHPGEELRSQPFDDVSELRRGFRRHMCRIQAESICLATPIFNTLARTSALADLAVASAYCIALNQVAATRPPASAGYEPKDQMMVIALGRLGMREFDLGSDADLVFVLKDADASEHLFWTRVAEKLIETLTAYTGEGNIFAVDTRLRPNGREGALVQLERTYMDYFERAAEAWEGITYMKSLGISGDIEHATRFLTELQVVDWRRYGQSGRSQKELRRMRARLEKEQGAENPLKAGPGGYFDIDFALMYLRLRGAGIFYKVLNTPERIDVIEKMGHLDHAEAVFLNDAATFYRAVDHGLRVSTGHTEGSLPHAPAQLQTLAGLVTRWTPEHLHDQELPVELSQIQDRTRAFFDRLFGA
jgi:glutamate-ammonia-ligase adenylyltransferase